MTPKIKAAVAARQARKRALTALAQASIRYAREGAESAHHAALARCAIEAWVELSVALSGSLETATHLAALQGRVLPFRVKSPARCEADASRVFARRESAG